MRTVLSIVAAGVLLTGSLAGCSGGGDDTLVVGATPVPHAEILEYVAEELAPKENLTIEIKEFTDYVQPNLAVDAGDIDANYFQHRPYLEEFAAERGLDLVSVAEVHIEPLGAYSEKVSALEDLPEGAEVAVPNDATNLGRALKLLADEGLIELKDGVGTAATERDVTANPKKLKFRPLEAAQLTRSLPDVHLAVINGNYALQADLQPAKDALALESPKDNPYANLLVVKAGNEDDPRVRTLAKLLTSDEVKAFIEEKYAGSVIPVP